MRSWHALQGLDRGFGKIVSKLREAEVSDRRSRVVSVEKSLPEGAAETAKAMAIL